MPSFRRKPKADKPMPAWKWAQVTDEACRKSQGWTTYNPTKENHGTSRYH